MKYFFLSFKFPIVYPKFSSFIFDSFFNDYHSTVKPNTEYLKLDPMSRV